MPTIQLQSMAASERPILIDPSRRQEGEKAALRQRGRLFLVVHQ
jgi:hypothetical protein